MVVEFRLYRRFDADLIALCRANYPVSVMMREAVTGYANGRPVHYYIDELTDFDLNDDKTVRSRFVVPNTDYNTCNMLKKVKYRCRNAFVKTVLRNSLVQQNITCFFVDDSLNYLKNVNDNLKNVYAVPNVTSCSTIKTAPRSIAVADGIYVSSDNRTRRMKKRDDAKMDIMQSSATAMDGYAGMPQAQYTDDYRQTPYRTPAYAQGDYNNGYQQPLRAGDIQQPSPEYRPAIEQYPVQSYQIPSAAQTSQYNVPQMAQIQSGTDIATMQMPVQPQYIPPAQEQFIRQMPQYQVPQQIQQQSAYPAQQAFHAQEYTNPQSDKSALNSNPVSNESVNGRNDTYTQDTEARDIYDEPVNRTDTSVNIGLANNQQLMNLFDSL